MVYLEHSADRNRPDEETKTLKIGIVDVEIDPVFHLVPPVTKLRVTLTKREAETLELARAIAATVNDQARVLLDDEDRFYNIDDNWTRIEHGCLELTGTRFEYAI